MKFFKYTAAAAAILAMAGGVLAADRTLETDVVIVGAGAGGMTAAVASLDAGFKTVVLEKNAVVGGGGNYMEGTFAVGSRMQKADNIGVAAERQFRRVMDFHHWRINGKALSAWLKETAATMDWLDAHGVSVTVRDIKTDRPTAEELRAWHARSGLPLKRFFNTSGLQYKALGLKDKLPTMTEDEKLALLATDGMLVKRPLLVADDLVLVGFREKEWEERL